MNEFLVSLLAKLRFVNKNQDATTPSLEVDADNEPAQGFIRIRGAPFQNKAGI